MIAHGIQPVIRRPPDDPTFRLLNARLGWRAAPESLYDGVSLGPDLSLDVDTATGRQFDEPNGTFGGLVEPVNAAIGPAGSLYLVDRDAFLLRWFDRCECRFAVVPCFGGTGDDVRRLEQPNGIAISRGNLFVCDTGRNRLVVLTLHGFVIRAIWAPPAHVITQPWEPFAVRIDRRCRVLVSDRANGCVHRFATTGRWLDQVSGLDAPTHLAIDCDDRVFVVTEDVTQPLRVFDSIWSPVATPAHPRDVVDRFPPLWFDVDADGNLDLSAACVAAGTHLFDANGASIAGSADEVWNAPVIHYLANGTFVSEPLDSRIYQCVWHRIVLRGIAPLETRIRVSSYTTETHASEDDVIALASQPDAWAEVPAKATNIQGEWEALLRSPAGRFLVLKLELFGDGEKTPRIDAVRIEFPRISLRRYLPAVFGEEPVSADFTDRFLGIFDTAFRSIETHLDALPSFFDPMTTPAERVGSATIDFLSWLGSWIGLTMDRRLPESRRRWLLKNAARLFHTRGTPCGFRAQLLLWMGMDRPPRCCTTSTRATTCAPLPRNCRPEEPPGRWEPPPLVLEHYQLRRWLFLGFGRLGNEAMVWGQRIVNRSQLDSNARVGVTQVNTLPDPRRDPFLVSAHQFSVFVPGCFGSDPDQRKALELLIAAEKPAHTKVDIRYVEPRFRIGVQSCIGFDSAIGRYPQRTYLDDADGARLGCETVLSVPPYARCGPSMMIGSTSRIGGTSRLN